MRSDGRGGERSGESSASRSGMRLLPIWVFLAIAVATASWLGPIEANSYAVLVATGAASVAWLAALRLAARGAGTTRAVVIGAIVLRAVVLAAPDPGTSDDANRYVWEGALAMSGQSPYALAPADPALAEAAARWFAVHPAINHPEVSAAYPPVAQAAFAAVVALAEPRAEHGGARARRAMRAAFALADLLVLAPLCVLLRRRGGPPGLALAWGWSPLVLVEFAGAAHFDALGIALLVAALALLDGARGVAARSSGVIALAAATLVKLLPAVAFPFAFARRESLRWLPLFAAALALGVAPLALFEGGFGGIGRGLGEYGSRWESSGLVFPWIARCFEAVLPGGIAGATPGALARLAVGALWLGVVGLELRRAERDAVRGTAVALGAFVVLSPTLHPWYVAWVVPFVALRPRAAWAWLAVSAPLLHAKVPRWIERGVWEDPAWVLPSIGLPFLALAVVDRARAGE